MALVYDSILILSAFFFSFAATGAAYALLRRFQVLDRPNARSNHAIPTPRGGGLGIVFALTVFLLVAQAPYPLLAAFLWLAWLSFTDDLRGVSARIRLLIQTAAVIWVLAREYDGDVAAWLPQWLELPILAFAWLWFINLFNFMDGSDGLAASEAVAVALGIAAVAGPFGLYHPLVLYDLLIAAAALGFLFWNWHPARVFMGDVGSIPLGFLLGYLLITLAGAGYAVAALILPAVFVLDASVTLLKRLVKRERIFEAHSQHAYQRAIRAGMGHDTLACEVTGINLLLILLAVISTLGQMWTWGCLIAAYAAAAWLLFHRFYRYKGVAA